MAKAAGRRPALCACIALGVGFMAERALAQADEGPYVTASYQWQHDSNLFRLPAQVDPLLVIGRDSASETVQVQSLGVGFDKRYSLQHVQAELSLVNHRYQSFPQYNLLAKSYRLGWDWAYTPDLFGRVYLERDESANTFDDAQALNGDNARLRKRQGLEVKYGLDGPWQLQAALHQTRDFTDLDQFGEDSYRQTSADVGVLRRLGTGNRASARLRHSNGRNLDGSLAQGDDFRQRDLLLDLHWVLGGKTTADASLTLLQRRHPGEPEMDFSGHNASVVVNWQATGKTVWTFSGSTAIGSNQTASSTHARNDRLGLSGTWFLGSRTSLRGSLGETRRRLLGSPYGLATDSRRDRTRDASLTLVWSFQRNLSLQTKLQHSARHSTQAGADFTSTQASVGLSGRF